MTPEQTKILHLSDLHFGKINEEVLNDLKTYIDQHHDIDLIILTGDLTQRAKKEEFESAKLFLESLRRPIFIIPGNHDVPLYNIFLRFFFPYKKFCHFLGSYAQKYFENDRMALYGVWSTNKFSVSEGRLSGSELQNLQNKFKEIPRHKWRIIASHHDINPHKHKDALVEIGPHLILSGHVHQSSVVELIPNAYPLLVSAGTSTSTRTRKEVNSFNVITLKHNQLVIETFLKDNQGFKGTITYPFNSTSR